MSWHLWVPAVLGPLAPHAPGYERWLAARGYSRQSVRCRLWQLGQLSGWLEREDLAVEELTEVSARQLTTGQWSCGPDPHMSE